MRRRLIDLPDDIGGTAPLEVWPAPPVALAAGTVSGRPVLVFSAHDEIHLWDQEAGRMLNLPLSPDSDRVDPVRATAVGDAGGRTVLAVGTESGRILLYDAISHELLNGMPGTGPIPAGRARAIERLRLVSVGGSVCLLSVSEARELRLWNLDTPAAIPPPVVVNAPGVGDAHVTQRQGDEQLLTWGLSGARIWSLSEARQIGVLPGSRDCTYPGALGHVGGRLVGAAVVQGSGEVRMWDIETGRQMTRDLPLHNPNDGLFHRSIGSMELVPIGDSTLLVARPEGGLLHLWDPARARRAHKPLLWTLEGGDQVVASRIGDRTILVFPRPSSGEAGFVLQAIQVRARSKLGGQTWPDDAFLPGGLLPPDPDASIVAERHRMDDRRHDDDHGQP